MKERGTLRQFRALPPPLRIVCRFRYSCVRSRYRAKCKQMSTSAASCRKTLRCQFPRFISSSKCRYSPPIKFRAPVSTTCFIGTAPCAATSTKTSSRRPFRSRRRSPMTSLASCRVSAIRKWPVLPAATCSIVSCRRTRSSRRSSSSKATGQVRIPTQRRSLAQLRQQTWCYHHPLSRSTKKKRTRSRLTSWRMRLISSRRSRQILAKTSSSRAFSNKRTVFCHFYSTLKTP